MKHLFLLIFLFAPLAHANISEQVFVESPTDTDHDGKPDLISVTINRSSSPDKQDVIFQVSPYSQGGNQVDFHSTDVDLLPQDEVINKSSTKKSLGFINKSAEVKAYNGFANVYADSLGTGKSTGCPTVGDISETLASKAVIDWLNGRAKAFNRNGDEVKADWASGKVGMVGVSYNGTLPIMVASTGVKGLEAIVPIGAISNWYDYYRANGLVVNPGGYVGEDADILGKYIVRKSACKNEVDLITKIQGREHGDFNQFWQQRNYLTAAQNIKAAVFIAHGQSDWNVKQKQAIQLWEALGKHTPKRMFLHIGGHQYPSDRGFRNNVDKWFNHYVKGEATDIVDKLPIRVHTVNDNKIQEQARWPHEDTYKQDLQLGSISSKTIVDIGSTKKLEEFIKRPQDDSSNRFLVLSNELESDTLFSGTTKVHLTLSLHNRKAANITVALVQFNGAFGKIMTRGWADPQNHQDITSGELLEQNQKYQLSFPLEPKQFLLKKGYRLGILITSTDYSYTLRPSTGTEIEIYPSESSIEIFADSQINL